MPDTGNSGGKNRHKRKKDGNRYLRLAFTHVAVLAIQYYPSSIASTATSRAHALAHRKPPIVARAIAAKELAWIVYFMLPKPKAFNGTFKGRALSRTEQLQWPRLVNPPV